MTARLHVYTGDGKGKTTAAMGLALRSIGWGDRVLVAQFMKRGDSGELAALRRFENAEVLLAPPIAGFTSRMDDARKERTRAEQDAFAVSVTARIEETRPALIVLDEMGIALDKGMLDDQIARALLDAALRSGETAVTGRTVPAWLEERADYLSRIAAERHPYATEGLRARRGVEW